MYVSIIVAASLFDYLQGPIQAYEFQLTTGLIFSLPVLAGFTALVLYMVMLGIAFFVGLSNCFPEEIGCGFDYSNPFVFKKYLLSLLVTWRMDVWIFRFCLDELNNCYFFTYHKGIYSTWTVGKSLYSIFQ